MTWVFGEFYLIRSARSILCRRPGDICSDTRGTLECGIGSLRYSSCNNAPKGARTELPCIAAAIEVDMSVEAEQGVKAMDNRYSFFQHTALITVDDPADASLYPGVRCVGIRSVSETHITKSS